MMSKLENLVEKYVNMNHPRGSFVLPLPPSKPEYSVLSNGQIGRRSFAHVDMKIVSVAACLQRAGLIDPTDSSKLARLTMEAITHYSGLPKVRLFFLRPHIMSSPALKATDSTVPPSQLCRLYAGVENLLLEIYEELPQGGRITDGVVEAKVDAIMKSAEEKQRQPPTPTVDPGTAGASYTFGDGAAVLMTNEASNPLYHLRMPIGTEVVDETFDFKADAGLSLHGMFGPITVSQEVVQEISLGPLDAATAARGATDMHAVTAQEGFQGPTGLRGGGMATCALGRAGIEDVDPDSAVGRFRRQWQEPLLGAIDTAISQGARHLAAGDLEGAMGSFCTALQTASRFANSLVWIKDTLIRMMRVAMTSKRGGDLLKGFKDSHATLSYLLALCCAAGTIREYELAGLSAETKSLLQGQDFAQRMRSDPTVLAVLQCYVHSQK
jgi:hypothetical protein